MKNVVAGLGEIGYPIFKLISKYNNVIGFDINPKLMDQKLISRYESTPTSFLHVCIPFSKHFMANVISLYNKFKPKYIVIHSTISPYTTKKLQNNLPVPVIYSATRGVHRRMVYDLKRYTKFFSIEPNAPAAKIASSKFKELMKSCGIKTKKMSNPITLELAKILVDTSYYGWLINYAQLSNFIAKRHNVDYEEMWSFSDEIHKFLGNRPKLFPGFIGGHCVIPNLDLIHNQTLDNIKKFNDQYRKKLKKVKIYRKKNSKKN